MEVSEKSIFVRIQFLLFLMLCVCNQAMYASKVAPEAIYKVGGKKNQKATVLQASNADVYQSLAGQARTDFMHNLHTESMSTVSVSTQQELLLTQASTVTPMTDDYFIFHTQQRYQPQKNVQLSTLHDASLNDSLNKKVKVKPQVKNHQQDSAKKSQNKITIDTLDAVSTNDIALDFKDVQPVNNQGSVNQIKNNENAYKKSGLGPLAFTNSGVFLDNLGQNRISSQGLVQVKIPVEDVRSGEQVERVNTKQKVIKQSEAQPIENLVQKPSFLQSVRNFFSSKIDINAPDRSGKNLLQQAVFQRDFQEIKSLVKQGANVNVQDRYGDTPLHIITRGARNETAAELHDTFAILQFLIDQGADVNTANKLGQIPVHIAIQNLDVQAVEFFIKNKANLNLQDKDGQTSLMIAVHRDISQYVGIDSQLRVANNALKSQLVAIIKRLVKAGADVTIPDAHGRLPLDDAKFRVAYPNRYGLLPEVVTILHEAQFPKIKKVVPQGPAPYQRISIKKSVTTQL